MNYKKWTKWMTCLWLMLSMVSYFASGICVVHAQDEAPPLTISGKLTNNGFVLNETVNYQKLDASKTYILTSKLIDVATKKVVVTDKRTNLQADSTGNGSWEIELNLGRKVKGGQTYDVEFQIRSTDGSVDMSAKGTPLKVNDYLGYDVRLDYDQQNWQTFGVTYPSLALMHSYDLNGEKQEFAEVVYCFNMPYSYPENIQTEKKVKYERYTLEEVQAQNLKYWATKPLSQEDIDKIMRIIYYTTAKKKELVQTYYLDRNVKDKDAEENIDADIDYTVDLENKWVKPNGEENEKLVDLKTNARLYRIAQYAIWHVTDGLDFDKNGYVSESFRNNEAVKHLQGYEEGNPNKQFLKSHAFDDVIVRSIAQKAGIPMEDNSDEEESSGGIFGGLTGGIFGGGLGGNIIDGVVDGAKDKLQEELYKKISAQTGMDISGVKEVELYHFLIGNAQVAGVNENNKVDLGAVPKDRVLNLYLSDDANGTTYDDMLGKEVPYQNLLSASFILPQMPEQPEVEEKKEVVFSKQDIAGNEIAGAQIQIKQGEEVVEKWTSKEGQSHQINLAPGRYTFHEETAPKGYVAVTDFAFTVNADGTVEVHETQDAKVKDGKVVVTDQVEKKSVTFSKQDIAGKEIAGAQIQIKQGEEVVEKWTSKEGQSHQINLAPGSYTFHEEAAPNGYLAVTDFTFTVKADGTVELGETSDAKVKDGKVVVTDQAEKKKVTFSKQDIAGKEIAGAQIQIKQGEEVVEKWTSKEGQSHQINLAPGSYTFHEETAPKGYVAVTDFAFTVNADGTVEVHETPDAKVKDGKVVVTDQVDKKEVVFSKQDIAGKEIAGAQIQIKQGEEVVEKWTSKEGQSHQINLAPGSYTFHEEAAPNGYLAVTDFTFTVKADGTVELGETSDAKVKDGKVVVTDQADKKEVVFSKQDIAGKEIAGAQIQIKQGEEVVEKWTSKEGQSHQINLAPGSYTFHEETAPKGYVAVTDFAFTVNADGTVEVHETPDAKVKDGKVVVTDQVDKKEVVFSKQDIAGKEIAGAQIQIKQGEEVVEKWTSKEGQSHQINLAPGSYTFHEEAAPNGYLAVTDFTFTVKADGTVELGETSDAKVKDGKVVVTDQADKKEVVFSKQDIAGKEIAGAQIQIKQGEEVVEKWTSKEGQSHQINLAPGSYTFHEEAAPNGYLAVTDFTFTVKADGTVEVSATPDAKIEDGKLVVTDQKKPEVPTVTTKKVVFSKQNVAGEEIAGAKIQIKQGDKVVESWTSEAGKSHTVKLEPGEYTFHEEAAPNGYLAVTDFTFTVKADGTVELGETSDAEIKDGKLVVTDQKKPEVPTVTTKKVVFSKQNVAGEEITGAKIQIKQGDKVVESWTSEAGKSHTVELEPGTYTFHEEAAPNGYLAVTDFTFTVKADGTVELGETSDAEIKDGKLVVTDQKKPEVPTVTTKKVVLSKQNVAGEEIAGAKIQIKQGDKVVESWTSEAGKSHTVKLEPGTYTFHEEAAPNGYLEVTDFTFTVKADGTVELGETSDAKIEDGKLVVTDQKKPEVPTVTTKKVVFSKQNVAGEEITGAKIQIKQGDKVVESWTSEAGKSHTVELEPGTYTFHEEAAPNGYLAVTDFTFTVKADGTVEVSATSDAKVENGKLVVTDQKEPDTPTYVNPKEGSLRTTVSANDLTANETHAVNLPSALSKQVKVVDTIYYTDLVAGESYQLTGALMKITSNGQAQTIATQTAKVVADATGTGTWSLNFGTLALEPGTKYVIFETAASEKTLVDTNKDNQPDTPHVVEHKNPNDLAQTIVVAKEVPTPRPTPVEKGNLRTTVSAANQNGSATKPATITAGQAKKVAVKDTVMYEKLVANQAYQLVGTLMHVKDGKVTPIATQSKDVIAAQTGNGQWVLDFGTLTLQSGETYVVYEVATSKEKLVDTNNDGEMDASQVVEHKNPNDLSQTIVVENEKPTEPQPKEITFSKQNVDGEEIAGAKIQIKQNGKVISEWTSEKGQSHVIKLLPGTYTFHEEAAPNGYLKVTDFEFTISEDGKVSLTGKVSDVSMVNGKLVIVDQRKEIIPPTPTPEPTPEPTPTEPQPKEITFSKQNVDGEEIAGAKIQIKQNGKVISEWTSEKGQSHVIKLLPGTYTFHEEAAPNGYLKVTDFEFTIDENGKVTVKEGQKDVKIVDGKLIVIDQRKEKTPKDELKKERKQKLPKSGTQAIHPMAGLAMILIGLSVFGSNIRFRKN
ncbi:SpaA isopeptide-forming pilin-related protein [Enterococcus cecorum]|uniref:SpaA isopeptide-forming pilin-related protein n=1 Tax=Enterococcus cecorum TaxID=44008 RepID=UPI0032647A1D